VNFNAIESSDRARRPLVVTNKNFHEKQTASHLEVLYFHHIVAINLDSTSEAVSEVAGGNQLSLLCLR